MANDGRRPRWGGTVCSQDLTDRLHFSATDRKALCPPCPSLLVPRAGTGQRHHPASHLGQPLPGLPSGACSPLTMMGLNRNCSEEIEGLSNYSSQGFIRSRCKVDSIATFHHLCAPKRREGLRDAVKYKEHHLASSCKLGRCHLLTERTWSDVTELKEGYFLRSSDSL